MSESSLRCTVGFCADRVVTLAATVDCRFRRLNYRVAARYRLSSSQYPRARVRRVTQAAANRIGVNSAVYLHWWGEVGATATANTERLLPLGRHARNGHVRRQLLRHNLHCHNEKCDSVKHVNGYILG